MSIRKFEPALIAAALVLYLPSFLLPAHSFAPLVLRWLAVFLFAAVALGRRTLTPWIFVAMVAGAQIGFDAPAFAVHLRVFSDIFLRLIKAVVAPLILATLISGIAGHGDLKQVGRMGIKSLVYFEVLTTLALVIGLVAINLSKAGVGMKMSTLAVRYGLDRQGRADPLGRFSAACVPGKYCKVSGGRADFAGGRVRRFLRHCARHGKCGQA